MFVADNELKNTGGHCETTAAVREKFQANRYALSRRLRFAVSPLKTFETCAQMMYTSQRLSQLIIRGKNSFQNVGVTKKSSQLAWFCTVCELITVCALSLLRKGSPTFQEGY